MRTTGTSPAARSSRLLWIAGSTVHLRSYLHFDLLAYAPSLPRLHASECRALSLLQQGKWRLAVRAFECSVELLSNPTVAVPPEALTAATLRLGHIYNAVALSQMAQSTADGREIALELLDRANRLSEQSSGLEPADQLALQAETMANLAAYYRKHSKLRAAAEYICQAENLFLELFELDEERMRVDGAVVANNSAVLHFHHARHDEAVICCCRGIQLIAAADCLLYERGSAALVTLWCNLCVVYETLRQEENALDAAATAVGLAQKRLGDAHELTLKANKLLVPLLQPLSAAPLTKEPGKSSSRPLVSSSRPLVSSSPARPLVSKIKHQRPNIQQRSLSSARSMRSSARSSSTRRSVQRQHEKEEHQMLENEQAVGEGHHKQATGEQHHELLDPLYQLLEDGGICVHIRMNGQCPECEAAQSIESIQGSSSIGEAAQAVAPCIDAHAQQSSAASQQVQRATEELRNAEELENRVMPPLPANSLLPANGFLTPELSPKAPKAAAAASELLTAEPPSSSRPSQNRMHRLSNVYRIAHPPSTPPPARARRSAPAGSPSAWGRLQACSLWQAPTEVLSSSQAGRGSGDMLRAARLELQHTKSAVCVQSCLRSVSLTRARRVRWGSWKQRAQGLVGAVVYGITDRLRLKKSQRAAVVIQRIHRGSKERQWLDRVHSLAIALQKLARGYRARVRFSQQIVSVVQIQRIARGWLLRRLPSCAPAAVRIQAAWRMVLQWRCYEDFLEALLLVQAVWRGALTRRAELKARCAYARAVFGWWTFGCRVAMAVRLQAAVLLQSVVRRRAVVVRIHRESCAQRVVRKYMHRRKFNIAVCNRRFLVTKLQAFSRAVLARTKLRQQQAAALRIQPIFRGYVARRRLLQQHRCATLIAAICRRWSVRALQVPTRMRAAETIGSRCHGWFVRRKLQTQQSAACTLQAITRGQQARARVHKVRSAARVLLRALVRYSTRKARCASCTAATRIQAVTRGHQLRIALSMVHNAAGTIQRSWRRYSAKLRSDVRRNSLLLLQEATRRMLATRARSKMDRMQHASLHICRVWRGLACRNKLSRAHKAAVVIQSAFRSKFKLLDKYKAAVSWLQPWFRGCRSRHLLSAQMQAACVIQSHARARKAQRSFNQAVDATVKLQSMARQRLQQRYCASLQQSGKVLVRAVRRWLRERRTELPDAHAELCASTIQRAWRRYKWLKWMQVVVVPTDSSVVQPTNLSAVGGASNDGGSGSSESSGSNDGGSGSSDCGSGGNDGSGNSGESNGSNDSASGSSDGGSSSSVSSGSIDTDSEISPSPSTTSSDVLHNLPRQPFRAMGEHNITGLSGLSKPNKRHPSIALLL